MRSRRCLRMSESRRSIRMTAIAWALLLACCPTSFARADDTPARKESAAAGAGALAPSPRVPWTGSRFAGTPDPPPPYTIAPAFSNLKFEFPVVLVPAQGTSRLFVGDLRGRIYSFPNAPLCGKADLAVELGKLHPDLSAF